MKKQVKKLLTFGIAAGFAAAGCMTAFAGEWKQDSVGWWYQQEDGSYPVNSWQWLDGNHDGIAECYYFSPAGYCLMNANTPDGYQVNESGAWIVNGLIQTKNAGEIIKDDGRTGKAEEETEEETEAEEPEMKTITLGSKEFVQSYLFGAKKDKVFGDEYWANYYAFYSNAGSWVKYRLPSRNGTFRTRLAGSYEVSFFDGNGTLLKKVKSNYDNGGLRDVELEIQDSDIIFIKNTGGSGGACFKYFEYEYEVTK